MKITHQAKSDDIYIYFKQRKYWKELKDDVLKYMGTIFDGDFSSFNDFVDISEHYNLLKENYLKLAEDTPGVENLISLFAATLERLGAMLIERFYKSDNDNYKTTAKICYELSIKLNPFLIPSYGALATVYGYSDNIDEAIKYCDKGIRAFGELQKTPEDELSYHNRALSSDTSILAFLKELKNMLLEEK